MCELFYCLIRQRMSSNGGPRWRADGQTNTDRLKQTETLMNMYTSTSMRGEGLSPRLATRVRFAHVHANLHVLQFFLLKNVWPLTVSLHPPSHTHTHTPQPQHPISWTAVSGTWPEKKAHLSLSFRGSVCVSVCGGSTEEGSSFHSDNLSCWSLSVFLSFFLSPSLAHFWGMFLNADTLLHMSMFGVFMDPISWPHPSAGDSPFYECAHVIYSSVLHIIINAVLLHN